MTSTISSLNKRRISDVQDSKLSLPDAKQTRSEKLAKEGLAQYYYDAFMEAATTRVSCRGFFTNDDVRSETARRQLASQQLSAEPTFVGKLLRLLSKTPFKRREALPDQFIRALLPDFPCDLDDYTKSLSACFKEYAALINELLGDPSVTLVKTLLECRARDVYELEERIFALFEPCLVLIGEKKAVQLLLMQRAKRNEDDNRPLSVVSLDVRAYSTGIDADEASSSPQLARTLALLSPSVAVDCPIVATWMAEGDADFLEAEIRHYLDVYTVLPSPPSHVLPLHHISAMFCNKIVYCGFLPPEQLAPLCKSRLPEWRRNLGVNIRDGRHTAYFQSFVDTPSLLVEQSEPLIDDTYYAAPALSSSTRCRRQRVFVTSEAQWQSQISQTSNELVDLDRMRQVAQIVADYALRLDAVGEKQGALKSHGMEGDVSRLLLVTPENLFIGQTGKVYHLPMTAGVAYMRDFVPDFVLASADKARRARYALLVALARFVYFVVFGGSLDELASLTSTDIAPVRMCDLRARHFPEYTRYGSATPPLLVSWLVLCLTDKIQTADIASHAAFTCLPSDAYRCTVTPSDGNSVRRQMRTFMRLIRRNNYTPAAQTVMLISDVRREVVDSHFVLSGSTFISEILNRTYWRQLWNYTNARPQLDTMELISPDELSLRFENEEADGHGVTREVVMLAMEELKEHAHFEYDEEADMLSIATKAPAWCKRCRQSCVFDRESTWGVLLLLIRWIVAVRGTLPFRLSPQFLRAFVDTGDSGSHAQSLSASRLSHPLLVNGLIDMQDDGALIGATFHCDAHSSTAHVMLELTEKQRALTMFDIAVHSQRNTAIVAAMRAAFSDVNAVSHLLCSRSLSIADAALVSITAEHVLAALSFESVRLDTSAEVRALFAISEQADLKTRFEDDEQLETLLELAMNLGYENVTVSESSEVHAEVERLLPLAVASVESQSCLEMAMLMVYLKHQMAQLVGETLTLLCDWVLSARPDQLATLWRHMFGQQRLTNDAAKNVLKHRVPRVVVGRIANIASKLGTEPRAPMFGNQSQYNYEKLFGRDFRNDETLRNIVVFVPSTKVAPLPKISSCFSSLTLGVCYDTKQRFADMMYTTLVNSETFTTL